MERMDGSVKGILKGPGSSGLRCRIARDSLPRAKFDELNVLATFHPADKDYGHMVIDEPKTPFVFEDDISHELDPEALMEKLRLAAQSETPAFGMEDDSDDSSDDEDYPESIDEKVHRMEFERRRKLHYKEFLSVPLARRLIAEEFGDKGSEQSVSIESTQSCVPETCPFPSISEYSEGEPDQTNVVTASHDQQDYTPPTIEMVEPGLDPGHHCYQKIMTDLYGPDYKPSESRHTMAEAATPLRPSIKRNSGIIECPEPKPGSILLTAPINNPLRSDCQNEQN